MLIAALVAASGATLAAVRRVVPAIVTGATHACHCTVSCIGAVFAIIAL